MHTASTTNRRIREICELEKRALARRSFTSRIGDNIAAHAGKAWFIVAHFVWFSAWILANLNKHGPGFDLYPFPLLNLIVSLEAIFLSLFILMSQNRSGLHAEQRNHLELQINLLAEDENTKILQMLQALCAHHRLTIADDPEIRAMATRTEITEVLRELKDNLPSEE